MMGKLELELEIEPLAVQSARFYRAGKGIRSYQPEKITGWKKSVRTMAIYQLPANFKMFTRDVPLRLDVELLFAPLKSMRNAELAGISAGKIVYKTSRGDLDNYSKALFDALNKIIWEDDSQIVDYHVVKRYSTTPGIKISLFNL